MYGYFSNFVVVGQTTAEIWRFSLVVLQNGGQPPSLIGVRVLVPPTEYLVSVSMCKI